MQAELEAMRERLAKEVEALENHSGKGVMFSPTGPISMGLAKAIIDALEAQAKEIEALKASR